MKTAGTIVVPRTAAGICKDNQRDYLYDWMRIIATFLIVVYHSKHLGWYTENGSFFAALPKGVSPVYYSFFFVIFRRVAEWCRLLMLPLFFAVSGSVLRLKPIGRFDSFFVSKVRRLIVPFFIGGLLFTLPVKYLVGFYTKGGLLRALKGYWAGTDCAHLWFLFALFWSMLLFVGVKKLFERFHCSSEAVLFLTAVAIHIASRYIPFNTFSVRDGLKYYLYFVCGYIFQGLRRKYFPDISVEMAVALLVTSAALWIVNLKVTVFPLYPSIFLSAVLCYSIAVLLTKIFPNAGKSRFFRMLMRTQILIYILHDPLQYVLLRVFTETSIMTTGFGCYLYLFSRTIGLFFVSMLLGELVLLLKKALLKLIR